MSLVTSTGVVIEHEIAAAVETPKADGDLFALMALLGTYVGIIPVVLGMLLLPAMRRFKRYCELMPQTTDETHARSWFRDQVLHPHETQHSLAEVLPLIEECNADLISTSINRFEPITDLKRVLEQEKTYDEMSKQR